MPKIQFFITSFPFGNIHLWYEVDKSKYTEQKEFFFFSEFYNFFSYKSDPHNFLITEHFCLMIVLMF